jgi:hypothetical protein
MIGDAGTVCKRRIRVRPPQAPVACRGLFLCANRATATMGAPLLNGCRGARLTRPDPLGRIRG